MTINGDKIYASVENEAYGGGSNSMYYFFIADWNTGTNCYAVQSDTSMTAPTWAAFSSEDASEVSNNAYQPLAGFDTTPFQGASINTGSSAITINNFLTFSEDMHNQAGVYPFCYGSFTTNVVYGSLSSTGDFSTTYSSSQYTPYYATQC
ncbi:MAG: hypothetical protein M1587_10340 [Thaumarchaeota archaeon]|nr:hypothetical protein [Nitrososphaerota archaeon]